MKVYLYGIPVPMQHVTWELLCNTGVRVDPYQDVDVNYPDEIGRKAVESIEKLYHWSSFWSQPWWKKIFRKGPSL